MVYYISMKFTTPSKRKCELVSDKILTGEEIRMTVIPLLKKFRAEKTILFGSYARKDADGQSDIDLLIIGGRQFVPKEAFVCSNLTP